MSLDSEPQKSLDQLPANLITAILQRLSLRSLLSVAATCDLFHELVYSTAWHGIDELFIPFYHPSVQSVLKLRVPGLRAIEAPCRRVLHALRSSRTRGAACHSSTKPPS